MRIALLGAESTGKSDLGEQLERHFMAQGKSVQHIPEYLREWCDARQRTPRMDEQHGITTEQIRQINAALPCDYLIADTTALMVAIYSDLLFDDTSLYDLAVHFQKSFDVTLLMGLDIPWIADGIQRDGAHMREPVDTKIRAALTRSGIHFQVVYGLGENRLQHALQCLNLVTKDTATKNTAIQIESQSQHQDKPQSESQFRKLRNWVCERCSDPECEHRLFQNLLKNPLLKQA